MTLTTEQREVDLSLRPLKSGNQWHECMCTSHITFIILFSVTCPSLTCALPSIEMVTCIGGPLEVYLTRGPTAVYAVGTCEVVACHPGKFVERG